MNTTNAEIVADKAEAPCFEELYDRYYPSVLGYLCKKINNLHDAEDLAGEIFLYVYQRFDSYDSGKSSFTTWLYLIVNSRLKNYYRDRKESYRLSDLESWLFAEESDMGRAVYLEQLRRFMDEALSSLSQKQRDIIAMRYFRNMDYADIAARMGTTAGNVRVIVSRTLARLEKLFSGTEFDRNL